MADPQQPERPRLRFSQLKLMSQSAMHYQHRLEHELKTTAAMIKGSAVHAIIAGTGRVIEYTLTKDKKGPTWEAFEAEHPDAYIFTPGQYRQVNGMAEAVLRHDEATKLLMWQTRVEDTIHFDYCGRPFRTTPDAWAADRVVELKTSQSSEPEAFMRHAQRMHYHGQLALHLHGVAAKLDGAHSLEDAPARDAYIVAVEATAPHPVTVLRLSAQAIDLGARAVRLWFERLQSCEASNAWPPYAQSIIEWDIEDAPELIFGDDGDAPDDTHPADYSGAESRGGFGL
jgi:hypothetical protein